MSRDQYVSLAYLLSAMLLGVVGVLLGLWLGWWLRR